MSSCFLIRKHIDVFVDGELDPATLIEFERHLAVCAGCQEMLRGQRAFKAELKRRLGGAAAPDALRARIAQAIELAPEPEEVPRRSRELPLVRWVRVRPSVQISAAAAVMLALALGGYLGTGDRTATRLAGALPIFEDVVRRHTAAHPSELSGVPPREVTQWFRGKVEFPVRPVEFSDPSAHLVGARLSSVNGREAATLIYEVGGQRVTVVAIDPRLEEALVEPAPAQRGPTHYQVRGYTVAVMPRGGVTYLATGDVDQRVLLRLVSQARVAN